MGRPYSVVALLNGIEPKAARESSIVFNVQGDYYAQTATHHGAGASIITNVERKMSSSEQNIINSSMKYAPATWEKVIVYLSGLFVFVLMAFLVVRNEPIADPNLVVILRTIISLVVAVFGATIPGMLKVDLSLKGISIRAMGALALFVICYAMTPSVISVPIENVDTSGEKTKITKTN